MDILSKKFSKTLVYMLVGLMTATMLGSCQTTGAGKQGSVSPGATQVSESPGQGTRILTSSVPQVTGPRRVVSVGKFDAIGGFTSKYGSWDVGGGLSAMMTTALVESDRFIVVERANLSQILSEQEMKASGVVNRETGPALGKLAGVQLLIYGSVTEFGAEEKGGGFSVGVSGGSIGSMLGGAFSRQAASGSVAMDIRLVDTSTGQVIKALKVREPIDSSGWDLSAGYRGISFGTNQFYRTPLGQAARAVITKAVQMIAYEAGNIPWTASVVDFDGQQLYISAGARSGVRVGDRFIIQQVTRKLTDPKTGEVLGIRRKDIGILKLDVVEPKLAYGVFSPLGRVAPRRGDLVVMMK